VSSALADVSSQKVSYQRRVKGSNEGIWLPFTEHGKQGLSD
jgi:hypothetical protein